MARELSERSKVIRAAIAANPDVGNTKLAELINDSADRLDDKIKVTAQEVGNQRQALKALASSAIVPAGAAHEAPPVAEALVPDPQDTPPTAKTRNGRPRKKPGRKPGSKKPFTAPAAASVTAPKAPKQAGVVEVLDKVFALAEQVGGLGQLQKLVDRLASR